MSPSTEVLVNDPSYLAYKFNFDTETIAFLPVERNEINNVSALKRGYIDAGRAFVELPLADVVTAADTARQKLQDKPPQFIFHTAYCASTFLSRCLAVDGVVVGLREPQLLLDAANAKRLQWRSQTTDLTFDQLPQLFLSLLGKHAADNEHLLIKPINSVNNIIPELMSLIEPAKSLLMFTDARRFVLSTLRKGEGAKQTIRAMFDLLRCDFPHLANLQLTHTIHMTDLRIIMTLWRLQLEQARQALKMHSPARMASLYSEQLIDSPAAALAAANRFFELQLSEQQIDSVVNADAFSEDAKNRGTRFDKDEREHQYQQLEDQLGTDLTDGLDWLVRNNPGTELVPSPGNALL